ISRLSLFLFPRTPPPPISTLFPYTTLFRSCRVGCAAGGPGRRRAAEQPRRVPSGHAQGHPVGHAPAQRQGHPGAVLRSPRRRGRSEEHTSELQSLAYLVCRLLLEKKKKRLS